MMDILVIPGTTRGKGWLIVWCLSPSFCILSPLLNNYSVEEILNLMLCLNNLDKGTKED